MQFVIQQQIPWFLPCRFNMMQDDILHVSQWLLYYMVDGAANRCAPFVFHSNHIFEVINSTGVFCWSELAGANLNERYARDCHGWLGCSPIWTSIFDDFFQHLWPYIGHNTANVVFQMVKRLWLIRIERPMTLHSPTENSLAVLNHKILEANSQVQNVKLGGHQTCLFNKSIVARAV
ncbi:uncharacterized protein TNCV_1972231 [Trichonephila clavipes]|nr:uncharacterized protein TNCV_1972231 [Trichonephila clavipes]